MTTGRKASKLLKFPPIGYNTTNTFGAPILAKASAGFISTHPISNKHQQSIGEGFFKRIALCDTTIIHCKMSLSGQQCAETHL